MTLDRELGQMKLEDALERVDRNAEDFWKDRADEAYRHAAERFPEFTNDAVWEILEDEWRTPHPPEGRALGARTIAAKKEGLIEATGRYVPSDRPNCHRNPIPVYRSLVYRGGDDE